MPSWFAINLVTSVAQSLIAIPNMYGQTCSQALQIRRRQSREINRLYLNIPSRYCAVGLIRISIDINQFK